MTRSPRMENLLSRDFSDLPAGLRDELFAQAEEQDAAYRLVMEMAKGDPVGLELMRNRTNGDPQWTFIVPEMSEPNCGAFRLQYFDERGFFSHSTKKTVEEALEAAINQGFTEPDFGALDRISTQPVWHRGMEVADLIQKLNSQCITHNEFQESVREVDSRYQPA